MEPTGRSMILCVTLNPCLDKTLTVPDWQPGDSVRAKPCARWSAARGTTWPASTRLGRSGPPGHISGGPVGEHCAGLLRRDDGLDPLITPTEALTRVILTVRTENSPNQTAFFDPDPAVTTAEAEALFHQVEATLAEGR